MAVTIKCSTWDFFEYNQQGPRKNNPRSGMRMFIEIIVTEPGWKDFKMDMSVDAYLICSPAGRVIKSGKYKENATHKWNAQTIGTYLLKIWTPEYLPDLFDLTVGPDGIETVRTKIWSGASSNKDGSLLDKGLDVKRKNGIFAGETLTRRDRVKKKCR